MPETPLGIPYPDLNDPPDGPFALQQLAEGVDALLSEPGVVRLRSSVYTQNLPDNTAVTVAFDTVAVDQPGWADLSNNRIVVGADGWYHIAATLTLLDNDDADGYAQGVIKVAGTLVAVDYDSTNGWRTTVNPRTTGPVFLAAGSAVIFEFAANGIGATTPASSGPIELALWRA